MRCVGLVPLALWSLPGAGIEFVSPASAGRVSTTGPPGKSTNGLYLQQLFPTPPFPVLKKKKFFFFFFSRLGASSRILCPELSSLVFPNKPIFLLSYCFILTRAYSAGEHTSYHKASPTQLASEHTSCLMCDVHLEFIGRVR